MRRARIAAGLPIEGGLQVPVEDTEVPSQVDIASTESVASSLQMSSIASDQVVSETSKDKPVRTLAQSLSVDFGRPRSSWYGRGTVGGGGKAIGAFTKGIAKTSAGSGATVAASLRSLSVNSLLHSEGYNLPISEEKKKMGRYEKPSGSSSLFDDGNVFT